MKELSIEEKAKAYDEAKARMSRAYNSNRCTIGFMNEIFPELKESEDEIMRKAIIQFTKENGYKYTNYNGRKIAKEEMTAWLEKQGEHANFRNKIQIGDKVTRNRDGVLVNLSQLNRVAKIDEKQGEQKPYGQSQECVDCQFNYAGECKGSCAMKRGEQNPAWSEEDEKVLHAIRNALNYEKPRNYLKSRDFEFTDILDWLKSLKDRIPPKQEWSEEDATHYNRILKELNLQKEMPINASVIEEVKSDIIWFKSLRPQNR